MAKLTAVNLPGSVSHRDQSPAGALADKPITGGRVVEQRYVRDGPVVRGSQTRLAGRDGIEMNPGPPLSNRERDLLVSYVEGVEASARNRKPLVFLAAFAVILGVAGVRELAHFWSNATARLDASALTKSIDMPDNAPPQLWTVAEARRTAALLHAGNRIQMFAVLEGVMGLIMLSFSLVALISVLSWWRNAERNAVMAKVGRWQLEQWGRNAAAADE